MFDSFWLSTDKYTQIIRCINQQTSQRYPGGTDNSEKHPYIQWLVVPQNEQAFLIDDVCNLFCLHSMVRGCTTTTYPKARRKARAMRLKNMPFLPSLKFRVTCLSRSSSSMEWRFRGMIGIQSIRWPRQETVFQTHNEQFFYPVFRQ